MSRMARWEPNARERLVDAALELFHERGYDRTTVDDIAARAGLTERTFFRYFADKREVLFGGSRDLEKAIADAIAGAPDDALPLDAVVGSLEAAATLFPPRRDYRARRALIASHPELQERELIKLAALASAITNGLRERDVADSVARLTAEAGVAIFKTAFERWVGESKAGDLTHYVRTARDELKQVALGADATNAKTTTRRRSSGSAKRRRAPR
jgi:AcrR family transcriptional regulator